VGLVNPGAACVAAVEDNLEDPSGLLPLVLGKREGVVELLEDQLHHALQLALLLRWQMVEVGAHRSASLASC
jgi:hypothetical protein